METSQQPNRTAMQCNAMQQHQTHSLSSTQSRIHSPDNCSPSSTFVGNMQCVRMIPIPSSKSRDCRTLSTYCISNLRHNSALYLSTNTPLSKPLPSPRSYSRFLVSRDIRPMHRDIHRPCMRYSWAVSTSGCCLGNKTRRMIVRCRSEIRLWAGHAGDGDGGTGGGRI